MCGTARVVSVADGGAAYRRLKIFLTGWYGLSVKLFEITLRSVARIGTLIALLSSLAITGCGGSGSDGSDIPENRNAPTDVRVGFRYSLLNQLPPVDEYGFPFLIRLRQDFTTMAALGARTVKITVFPSETGMTFRSGRGSAIDQAEIDRALGELFTVLSVAQSVGIQAVIAFMTNAAYLEGPSGFFPRNRPNWYDYSYASMGEEGKNVFGRDLAAWENAFITAIEQSPLANSVRVYLIATEMVSDGSRNNLLPGWSVVNRALLEQIFENTVVPPTKLSADMFWPDETPILADVAGITARPLVESEVHSYPAIGYNADIRPAFALVRNSLPNATVTLGELGVSYCGSRQNEDRQVSNWNDILNQAREVSAGDIINWGLWDDGKPDDRRCAGQTRWGAGFGPHEPRNLFGLYIANFSRLSNGDFEKGADGWTVDQPPLSLAAVGPSRNQAATGLHYLHVEPTLPILEPAHLCSSSFQLRGATAAMTGYIRTNLQTVSVYLETENGSSSPIALPVATTSTDFRAIQYLGEPFLLSIPQGSDARLCFALAGGTPGAFLDLDALSIREIGG